MNNKFNEIYLNILNEAKYDNQTWRRTDVYKDIQIYIRKDNHLQIRLNQRYSKYRTNKSLNIIKKFLKEQLKKQINVFNSSNNDNIPYTIYGTYTRMYISGRFKKNNNIWRCYIATALPNMNTTFNKLDLYREVYA